jgi:hypothetical protein
MLNLRLLLSNIVVVVNVIDDPDVATRNLASGANHAVVVGLRPARWMTRNSFPKGCDGAAPVGWNTATHLPEAFTVTVTIGPLPLQTPPQPRNW